MAKQTSCEKYGHTYQVTTSPGWFRCERCGAVAVCPGCLGCRLAGYVALFCPVHVHCALHDFPLVLPATETFVAPDADQLSFW